MCVVSNMGTDWERSFPERWPQIPVTYPTTTPPTEIVVNVEGVSNEDFEALKREVEELKILLMAAKRFDEATGQKDCEMDEKVEFIRKIADFVGVDVDEVFGSQQ